MTGNHVHSIRDERVKQYFVPESQLEVGKTEMEYEGDKIRIYDLERLLIETVRMKNRMPSDQYKEVIGWYRGRTNDLDGSKLAGYLSLFPHRERIMSIIDTEVY